MNNQILSAKELYARWARNYETDIATMNWTAHTHIFESVKTCLKQGIRIFEAGAGTGALARKLANHADDIQVEGTDISPDMIRIAQADPRNSNILIHQHNIETTPLSYKQESFDISVSCGVFEYLEKIDLACMEMARILKKNGLLSIAYEANPNNDPDRTYNYAHSQSEGIDEKGQKVTGAYFSYQHAPLKMEGLLRASGLSIKQHYNFNSAVVNGRPVHYNIITAQKEDETSAHIYEHTP